MSNFPFVPSEAESSPLPGSDTAITARRLCSWCQGELSALSRSDALTCSKRCRQARHRFGRVFQAEVASGQPRRLAYADPPYPGLAAKYYRDHPDYAGEVDHKQLVEQLVTFDGWALSTSAEALPVVLSLLSPFDGWFIASWFKGGQPGKAKRARSSWEPILVKPARETVSSQPGWDSFCGAARARLTDPKRVIGAKPPGFCLWLFRDLLRAAKSDSFADLFPGSGGVSRAWALYVSQEYSGDR